MILMDFILSRSETSLPFLLSTKKSVNVDEIKQKRFDYQQTLAFLRGKNVALCFQSNVELAIHIILLDGIVNRLLILPPDSLPEQRKDYLSSTDTEKVLSDFLEASSLADINTQSLVSLKNETNKIPTQWVLTTSGTTGVPKLVKHTLKSLTRTVKASNKEHHFVWGCLYHLHRFAGIQVLLQSLVANNQMVIIESADHLSSMLNLFIRHHVNCLSATPTLWRNILMLPKSKYLPLSQLTLGGEIADDNILSALTVAYPNTKIRHIYASTEAGVGFSVVDGLAGFPITYLNDGLDKVKLKVSDKNTLLIKSTANASGYIGGEKIANQFDYIDTGDVLNIEGERCYFMGRENGTINIGGNKVNPEYVEQVLMTFPGVSLAYVSAKKSSVMGSLVQCQLVVAASFQKQPDFIKQLKTYCKTQLKSYMVPVFFQVVDHIKLNNTGKISRNE